VTPEEQCHTMRVPCLLKGKLNEHRWQWMMFAEISAEVSLSMFSEDNPFWRTENNMHK